MATSITTVATTISVAVEIATTNRNGYGTFAAGQSRVEKNHILEGKKPTGTRQTMEITIFNDANSLFVSSQCVLLLSSLACLYLMAG